jgi:DNA (cytosine-5)-methyltransferase 1
MQSLNELGYDVDAFIIDAAHFVPQSRRRLFVIAAMVNRFSHRNNAVSLLSASELRPQMLMDYIGKHPGIRWRLRPLPSLPEATHGLKSILEDLPDDAPEWWSKSRTAYLLSQMSPLHREKADQMIKARTWGYGTVFRRIRKGKSMAELRCDGIAGCLRTPKGGSAKQILFKAGYGKHFARLLTPRECARLMGADDFRLTVKADQALFGFGDAVCVPVIEWIARHYLDPLVSEMLRSEQEPELQVVGK